MGTLKTSDGEFECLWASDVDFDGIRLEVLSGEGETFFDVSIPENKGLTVNTFANEVPATLILAAIELAQSRE